MRYIAHSATLLLIFQPVSIAVAALTDDLVGLYEFENDFQDSSGSVNANHGVPVNSPGFTSGKIGTGMSLTGVQDYLSFDPNVLSDFDFGDTNFGSDVDFTMSMWIRQDDFVSDPAVLSNKDWNSGDNTGINWAPKGNGIFDLNTKGSTGARRDLDTASNSFPLTVGAWNLVVMSVDRDGPTELYINGVNTGTIPVSSTGSFSSGLPWNVGQDGTGSYTVEFTGAVDELAVWHRAIASDEADALWNSGNGIDLGSQVVETRLKLVVDRVSGSMTIENNTGVDQDLIGYQIISSAGAFNQAGWSPVTGRLDAAGDGSLDSDDNWVVGTAPDSASDFIELSLGTGTLPADSKIELGSGLWAKFYQENTDVSFQYADGAGDDPIDGAISFVGGVNEPFGFGFGDLDFDGQMNSNDWAKLQSGFGTPLAELSEAQRYRAADLNGDGQHTLDDILEFRVRYDAVNGVGSFQAMLEAVPEPNTLGLLVFTLIATVTSRRSTRHVSVALLLAVLTLISGTARAANLFSEDFNGVPLGPNVDEGVAGSNVWTASAPSGWSIDNSSLPGGGVTEWRGWSFADPDWWAETADDQGRSQFTKGTGAVAVADPDEWDDGNPDAGFYNTFLKTPSISLAGAAENTAQLRFDSSWLPEDTQTAGVSISFDGGSAIELLRWTSVSGDSNFKPGNTNETVVLPINNPAGATNMTVEFGMTDAGNDWWWAIDNVEVFTPLTLQVDVQTGGIQLLGDPTVAINGYEISSPGGSLAASGWLSGNLDAQNIGSSVPAAADFNSSNSVDGADLAIFKSAFGSSNAADTDDDGDSDGADFLRWQRQLGLTGDPASTWTIFLATENQLIESYLFGNSTFASDVSLGAGYDTGKDLRDLVFTYTTDANEKMLGLVQYTNLPGAVASVPEPTTLGLLCLAALLLSHFPRPLAAASRLQLR